MVGDRILSRQNETEAEPFEITLELFELIFQRLRSLESQVSDLRSSARSSWDHASNGCSPGCRP